jgi:alpha-1,2-mannosyltransferase
MSMDKAARYGASIGLIVAAIAYYHRFAKDPTGVTLYPQAAECLLHHQLIPHCAQAFTYPPAFAFMMIPFVPLPMPARNILWYAVTLAALAVVWRGAELLALRLCKGGWSERELAIFRVTSAVLSLKFILAVLENQAYDLLALAFIVGGLCAIAGGRTAGAASLAVGAAIKATPLIFLPWLIITRRYMAAAVFIVVFAVASLLPDIILPPASAAHGHLVTWIQGVAGASLRNAAGPDTFAFWSGSNLLNHSLRGAVARLIDERADPVLFKAVLYATWLVFAAVLGALLLKSPRRDDFTGVDGALLLIGMLMLSPMTSRSHYVALMLPFMVLTAVTVKDRGARAVLVPLLALSFVLTTVSSNDLVGQRVTEWSYFYSLMPLGALVLMAGLGALVWRRPRPAALGAAV